MNKKVQARIACKRELITGQNLATIADLTTYGVYLEVAEIERKKSHTIPVLPSEHLLAKGMKRNNCHVNSWAWVERLGRCARPVHGWVRYENILISHSVVCQMGQMYCVTPNIFNQKTMDFIPDDDIQMIHHGTYVESFYKGVALPQLLYRNAPQVVAIMQRGLERLKEGDHPMLVAYEQEVSLHFGKDANEMGIRLLVDGIAVNVDASCRVQLSA